MKQIQLLLLVILLFTCLESKKIIPSHNLKSHTTRILQTGGEELPPFALYVNETVDHRLWRSTILANVTSLPRLGSPAEAIAFGRNTAVIVDFSGNGDILLTATELGQGRVLLISHDSYLINFTSTHTDANVKKLHDNIKSWMTKETFSQNSDLMDAAVFLNPSTNTTGVKALHFRQTTQVFTTQEKQRIFSFVMNGGGLFVGISPSVWTATLDINGVSQLLTYKTLLWSGMAYNPNIMYGGATIFPTNGLSTFFSHMGYQINVVLSTFRSTFGYFSAIQVCPKAIHLPDVIKAQIQPLIQASWVAKDLPTESNLVKLNYRKSRAFLYQALVLDRNIQGKIAPGISNFPYDVDRINPIVTTTKEFNFTALPYTEFHHTGYYAVAGQAVTINVIGALPANWKVNIGFHYDNNGDHSSWVRWPRVFRTARLNSNTLTIISPFGGLVIFENPVSTETLRVSISGIIEAPYYDSQNPESVSDWARRKSAPGAWGCAQGLYVGFCFPRASFQNVTNPSQVLDFYDQVYIDYHNLRGTNPTLHRRQTIVADIKPYNGYMHPGYPIVSSLDISSPNVNHFIFNYTYLRTSGHWGVFHEIGHNMQRYFWTYDGTGQVTVNIFSLRATLMAIGTSPKNSPWLIGQKASAQAYLLAPNFTKWQGNAGIALVIYAQVIEDFGWDVLRRVFTSYEVAAANTLPATNQAEIDTFWAKTSIEAGENLTPLLTKWAIPFTTNFTNQVSSLPLYTQKVNLFI